MTDYKFKSGDVISRTMNSGRTWIGIFKRYGGQGLFDSYCYSSKRLRKRAIGGMIKRNAWKS